jgi:hypothetical protein
LANDRPGLQYAGGFDLAGHVPRNDVPDTVDKVHVREAKPAKSTAARNSFAIAELEANDRDRRLCVARTSSALLATLCNVNWDAVGSSREVKLSTYCRRSTPDGSPSVQIDKLLSAGSVPVIV